MRHIGVCNFSIEQLRRAQAIAPVETLQSNYSLVARDVEREILPFCEREGIGVIAYSPMGSGLLTGSMSPERVETLPDDDWRKRDSRFRDPAELRSRRARRSGRGTARSRPGRGRGRLDAPQPGGRRRDRRLPAAATRSTRSSPRYRSS